MATKQEKTPQQAPTPAKTEPAAEQPKQMTFKQRLGAIGPRLKNLLPEYIAPERYLSLAMLAIERSPQLQKACLEAPDTVLNSILGAAQLGLEIGGAVPGAHLVPFNSKLPGTDKYAMQCQLIPDYRGLVSLAVDGEAISGPPDARVVYAGEVFEIEYGTNPRLTHKPDFAAIDAGVVVGVYVVAQLPNGAVKFEFMTKAQVDAIRGKSKAKDAMAWSDNYGEMAKKTVLKRFLKLVPMNPNNDKAKRLAMAVMHDNKVEGGEVEAGFDFNTEEDASQFAARQTARRVDNLKESMGVGRDVTDVAKEKTDTQAKPKAEPAPEPAPEPSAAPTMPLREQLEEMIASLVAVDLAKEETANVHTAAEVAEDETADDEKLTQWIMQIKVIQKRHGVGAQTTLV